MLPRKLDVAIARFPYGGNGGISSEVPEVGDWLVDTIMAMSQDERISRISRIKLSDTPITMTRNRAVEEAKAAGFDVLVMIDSDMAPDTELGDGLAKPFWQSSFDFLYQHYEQGPVVIGAPYCGPPPHENVYVFRWANEESAHPNTDFQLVQFRREDAAQRAGMEQVAALPTGLIMYDMRVFDVCDPPYFFYEYEADGPKCEHCGCRKPGVQAKKGSTEDVVQTRDLSLFGIRRLGYNPVYVNWDAWAGHWKPKCVRKPNLLTTSDISRHYEEAIRRDQKRDEKLTQFRSPIADELAGEAQVAFPDLSNIGVQPTNLFGVVEDMRRQAAEKPWSPEAKTESAEHIAKKFGLQREWLNRSNGDPAFAHVGFQTPDEDIDVLQKLVIAGRPDVIVEVGSWVGHTACAMAQACRGRDEARIYCVDTWQGSPHDESSSLCEQYGGKERLLTTFIQNVVNSGYESMITPIVKPSLQAAHEWPAATSIDFLFIDADHRYAALLADLIVWHEFVKPDGIICGHDYGNPSHASVKALIDDLGCCRSENGIWYAAAGEVAECLERFLVPGNLNRINAYREREATMVCPYEQWTPEKFFWEMADVDASRPQMRQQVPEAKINVEAFMRP